MSTTHSPCRGAASASHDTFLRAVTYLCLAKPHVRRERFLVSFGGQGTWHYVWCDDQFTDSAVIIKSRIKTQPLKQWRIGREMNRRIKNTFDMKGIVISFPHQTIYWGEPKGVPSQPT